MRLVHLPGTLDELWEVMNDSPGALLYAGGTDLLVRIRAGLLRPLALICLERIEALKSIDEQDDTIFIGAGVTHSQILESALIRVHAPVLTKAVRILGSPPVRHMGTIGGNIVNASPAADTLPPLLVLGARAHIMSRQGSRQVPLASFISGPGVIDLHPDEILAGVSIPTKSHFGIHHYEKIGVRKAQACAVASLAALVGLSEEGNVEAVRLAWGSVGPTVMQSTEVERMITGSRLNRETLMEAAQMVQRIVSPISDVRARAEYRRIVAGKLLLRLLDYVAPPEPGRACDREGSSPHI